MEEYWKVSKITNKKYNLFGVIRLLNLTQVSFYIKNNVFPVDIEVGESRKDGSDCLVFLFNKEDTKEVYDTWCNRRIEK